MGVGRVREFVGNLHKNIHKMIGCHFQHQTFDQLNFLTFSQIIY